MTPWSEFKQLDSPPRTVADPRRRLHGLAVLFAVCLLVVFGRCAHLAWGQREAYLAALSKPTARTVATLAPRGRILSRDGIVLARDEATVALSVDYRHLCREPDAAWLRRQAISELTPAERGDSQIVSAAVERRQAALAVMHDELARLCQLPAEVYDARRAAIERQVERIAESVNDRRRTAFARANAPVREFRDSADDTWRAAVVEAAAGLFAPPEELPPRDIPVREQRDYHVIHVGLPLAAVAYIESRPEKFPGVRIETASRRAYPQRRLAAHLVGYLGRPAAAELTADDVVPDELVGKLGVEKQYHGILRGTPGQRRQWLSPRGNVQEESVERPAVAGGDVLLSIDARLQRAAEQLLDAACERSSAGLPAGGAAVVMDARTGALLTLACTPRFDPSALTHGRQGEIEQLFADPRRPLFDRSLQMALPPGSVFKPLSAIAILEAGQTTPQRPFRCQGYFDQPHQLRCALYRRQGIGHGDIVLADALARSCNVYFFHHAGEIGHAPLVHWATQFGFGQTTGVDLPHEAAGELPTPRGMRERHGRAWQPSDTQLVAVGQGPITATPLQVAALLGAVANGGTLHTPSVLLDAGAGPGGDSSLTTVPARQRPSRTVGAISPQTLEAVREGLRRVGDEQGTAHRALRSLRFAIAGKTGTAEAGGDKPDHAWFAGYAPADAPHLVVVVVLEHGGGGETAAAAAAQILAQADRLKLLRKPASIP